MIPLGALLFAALIALSAALTRVMMTWSIIDTPNSRSSHQRPTPRTGGIAIAITCLCGWIMVYLLMPERDIVFRIAPLEFGIYVAIAIGVFLFSLADDIWGLKPSVKFLIQIMAALLFVLFVATFRELSIRGTLICSSISAAVQPAARISSYEAELYASRPSSCTFVLA